MESTTEGLAKLLSKAVLETISEVAPAGAPASTLYIVFMQFGWSLDMFERFMAAMVEANLLDKRGDLYFAKKG